MQDHPGRLIRLASLESDGYLLKILGFRSVTLFKMEKDVSNLDNNKNLTSLSSALCSLYQYF